MGIEMIVGLAVAVLGAIAAAFGFGHASGTTKTEAKFRSKTPKRKPLPLRQ
jgi:hypothetical protein